ELTTFDAYDAYWVRRDWAAEAPVKTQSRIDTPKPLASLKAGTVAVGGVAQVLGTDHRTLPLCTTAGLVRHGAVRPVPARG
ncbi:hypothetical protein, partial [Streptomyces atacamensis]|uniref:hypothetical protein n=1 Tax=Streptomyces atacamensis TaxID=531966 RepID=UPI00399D37E6